MLVFRLLELWYRKTGSGWLLRSCATVELGRWQRRCDRLTQLQRRIRFPPLKTITVNGEDIKLPLPSVGSVLSPTQEEIEYLVGFFDGDGCVTMQNESGQVSLKVSQSIDYSAVLLLFRSMLGGGIYAHQRAKGCSKATVQWIVSGSRGKQAAAVLSSISSMKHAQLEIAMGGSVALNDRALVEQKLKTFKQKQHVPSPLPSCSWPYFAGFFDAEGSIGLQMGNSLQLQLEQVNPIVLLQLQSFLHEKQLQSWSLYHYANSSALVCSNLGECKQTLELLLANGLLVKRRRAGLVLGLTAENSLWTRDAVFALTGWQKRYERLDAAGVVRARQIARVRDRLRYRVGSRQEYGALQRQLDELRSEHALQKLISRRNLLRKDVRQALREGGQVTPPASP